MKIVNRQPLATADISSARGTTAKELGQLVLTAAVVLVAAYFVIGLLVDLAVAHISFETESKIFAHFQPPAEVPENAALQRKIDRAAAILAKLRRADTVPPMPYRLVVIDHETPNAFAFPGGTVGLTTGLLDALDEEIEVAFVLGHELGHFHGRDHLQGLGRAVGFRIILAAVFGSGSGAASFGDLAEMVLQRGYSQKTEKAADRFALSLVSAVYGKTEGVDRLFQLLRQTDRLPKWAYMFATHPSPEARIEALKAQAATLDNSAD